MTRQTDQGADLTSTLRRSPAFLVQGDYWYSQLAAGEVVQQKQFVTISDDVETTVVGRAPVSDQARGPFALVRLKVAVPFESPGFLAAVASSLSARGMNVLLISTFTYDYLLIRKHEREHALAALETLGLPIER